jgi:hypothetical protein
MPTAMHPGYRTKRVAFRGSDGRVTSYLRVPDKADPAYQAHLDEHYAQLDALLERAAKELDMTPEELAEHLSQD